MEHNIISENTKSATHEKKIGKHNSMIDTVHLFLKQSNDTKHIWKTSQNISGEVVSIQNIHTLLNIWISECFGALTIVGNVYCKLLSIYT